MSRPRDFQRARLYRAETLAWGTALLALQPNRRRTPWALPTVKDCQAVVNHITESLGVLPIEVRDGRSRKTAAARRSERAIFLPRWSRTRPVIMHEVAHILRADNTPAHGAEFARCYLDLVSWFVGDNEAAVLEMAFENGKVRVEPGLTGTARPLYLGSVNTYKEDAS